MLKTTILLLLTLVFSTATILAQSNQETIIFLVRHAEKSLESSDNPSLSEVGKQQSENLAKMLVDAKIEVIYSTDTKRTKETVSPIAQILGLPIEIYPMNDKNLTADLIKKHKGKRILVVGHSANLPDLLNKFSKSQNYKPSDEYNALYLIIISNGQKPATILKLAF
ncbi:MAG: histidine phosphatase family protein [Microscillaceae bacterium]|jgi:broad specificity phosphatase PhoE|nr:histidine phosphatase family protein [Microscillaceae bacterium]